MTLQEVNQLTIDAYEQLASKYHESFKDEMTHKEYDKKILDQFSEMLQSTSKICDAGCGPSGHIGKYPRRKASILQVLTCHQSASRLPNNTKRTLNFTAWI